MDPVQVTAEPLGGDGPPTRTSSALPEGEGWVDEQVRERLWWVAGTLYRRRVLIVLGSFLAGLAAVVITLQMPNRYRAETRLLLPESQGIGGLLESVAPGAAALLGDETGGYTRYLAILSSRTMFESVVDRFDLVERYEIEVDDETNALEKARAKAVRELGSNTDFEVSLDFDYLGVQVLDEDPQVAAQMATYFVSELNRRHIELTSSSAAEYREFMAGRLRDTEAALDSTLAEVQAFQEQYGVVELETQAEALMGALADAQAEVGKAEAQYRALQAQLGDENPDVALAREVFQSARSQVQRLVGGAEAVMPVPLQRLPTLTRRYARLQADLLMHKEVLTVVRPLYEQAIMNEREEASAVQVLDPAVAPTRKAEPRRTLLVLGAVFSTGLLLMIVVLLASWARQRGGAVVERLQTAAG